MQHLNNLLENFKNILNSEIVYKKKIITVLFECTGVELQTNQVDIKNSILYLKDVSFVVKNEIFLRKNLVLDKLNDISSKKSITNMV